MATSKDYFDITKLYKVLEANEWKEGKNFMAFWAEGEARVAKVDPARKKSTIGANLDQALNIYTIKWSWLNKFPYVVAKYNELLNTRIKNTAVKTLLTSKKYMTVLPQSTDAVVPFNDWLQDGMLPYSYTKYIKNHQMQYIPVDAYKLNNDEFDDMVAALNGFNFFAFYKGYIINVDILCSQVEKYQKRWPGVAKQQAETVNPPFVAKPVTDPLGKFPAKHRTEMELLMNNPGVKKIMYVTHVGVYAGDIYEFNGAQYLATWNLKEKSVSISEWDALAGTSDTDDDEDLAITNETFQIYRDKTQKGGDFLALSPVKLVAKTMILPIK